MTHFKLVAVGLIDGVESVGRSGRNGRGGAGEHRRCPEQVGAEGGDRVAGAGGHAGAGDAADRHVINHIGRVAGRQTGGLPYEGVVTKAVVRARNNRGGDRDAIACHAHGGGGEIGGRIGERPPRGNEGAGTVAGIGPGHKPGGGGCLEIADDPNGIRGVIGCLERHVTRAHFAGEQIGQPAAVAHLKVVGPVIPHVGIDGTGAEGADGNVGIAGRLVAVGGVVSPGSGWKVTDGVVGGKHQRGVLIFGRFCIVHHNIGGQADQGAVKIDAPLDIGFEGSARGARHAGGEIPRPSHVGRIGLGGGVDAVIKRQHFATRGGVDDKTIEDRRIRSAGGPRGADRKDGGDGGDGHERRSHTRGRMDDHMSDRYYHENQQPEAGPHAITMWQSIVPTSRFSSK